MGMPPPAIVAAAAVSPTLAVIVWTRFGTFKEEGA